MTSGTVVGVEEMFHVQLTNDNKLWN